MTLARGLEAAVPPDANRGSRTAWRCPARAPGNHRCRYRAMHSGMCRAFGLSWWGIPKGQRRAQARILRGMA